MAGSNLSLLDEADPNTLDEDEGILDEDSDIVITYPSRPLFPPQNPPGQLDGDNRFTPDEKTYFIAELEGFTLKRVLESEQSDLSFQDLPLEEELCQIRLVTLPENPDHWPVVLHFQVVSLDDLPEFSALSYCWGEHLAQPSTVTKNLTKALRNLRRRNPGPLWIDQICIDQFSVEEKSSQVALMKRIYKQASRVIVWLGEQGDQTRAGLVVAMKIVRHLKKYPRHEPAAPDPLILLRAPQNLAAFYSLKDMLTRAWFTRKWVLQEIVLCPSRLVMLGGIYIHWDVFEELTGSFPHDTFRHIRKVKPAGTEDGAAKEYIRCMWWLIQAVEERKALRLIDLLVNTREFEVTDPRDHIYSLLGLAADSEDFPAPDYSLSCEDVYVQVAQCLVSQGHGVEVIAYARPQCKELELPSWVPDWSQYDALGLPHQYCTAWSAGGDSEGEFQVGPERSSLKIQGVVIDEVLDISDVIDYSLRTFQARHKWIESAAELVGRHISERTSSEKDVLDELARLIICDPKPEEWPQSGVEGELLQELLATAKDGMDPFDSTEDDGIGTPYFDTTTPLSQYLNRHLVMARDHRVIATQSGAFGMASPLTQPGDKICIFLGDCPPYILRKNGAGYELVGDAYVRGVMYGEVLQRPGVIIEEILLY